jgi:protein-tyrosine phosphatase
MVSMAKINTSQHSGHKRTSSTALSPRLINKNRYTPTANLEDQNDDILEEEDMDLEEIKQKIPPLYIYIYEINDYIVFLDKITPMIVDNFNINNKNVFLKFNLSTVDDYRTITKYLFEIKIKYHTYQLPEERIYHY